MSKQPATPGRSECEEKWTDLIDGRLTRDAVRSWAVAFSSTPIEDQMVRRALGSLAGFAEVSTENLREIITDAPPVGEFLRSMTFIAEHLQHWRNNCQVLDADPEQWRQVEYSLRAKLPDGQVREVSYSSIRKSLGIGDVINMPIRRDGKEREGIGFNWVVTNVEQNGGVLVVEPSGPR
jgi:hypothetical protein